VRDINPGPADSDLSLSAGDGRLLFSARVERCRVWESDERSGTRPPSFHRRRKLVVAGGLIFLAAVSVHGIIWAAPMQRSPCRRLRQRWRRQRRRLVRMVGIALGEINANTCSYASVNVDQLVTAVRNALLGC
jgi:hypothetical protein